MTDRPVPPLIPTYSQIALRAYEAERKLEPMTAAMVLAYRERDQLVAALSKLFPSHLERHPDADETWDRDWRWIVFIQFPAGQCSWHIHDSELHWFDHLARRLDQNSWDGHTTEEKYERVKRLELIHHLPRTKSEQVLDEYFRNNETFKRCMSPERVKATQEAIDKIAGESSHD